MRGRTVQEIMLGLDPQLRFMVPLAFSPSAYVIRYAGEMATSGRIPGTENAPIYADFIDLEGRICIGIAQDVSSPVDPEEWVHDQTARPMLRSYDCVDILGNRMDKPMEGEA